MDTEGSSRNCTNHAFPAACGDGYVACCVVLLDLSGLYPVFGTEPGRRTRGLRPHGRVEKNDYLLVWEGSFEVIAFRFRVLLD